MLNAAINVIEGQYCSDLLAQPEALQATLAWLREAGRWAAVRRFVGARAWRRIVLTGMGASYHTLHPLNISLIGAEYTPVMIEMSELVHYGAELCDERTLIVAVSQSGSSAEVLRLLELDWPAALLAVTNTADSPLARHADLALLAQAGPEFSVSCKTYVAGLLVLQWLAAVFTGKDERETLNKLEPAARLVEEYLQRWRAHTDGLAKALGGVRHLFLTGRGSSLAAVGTGALIAKESAHFHAEGMSSAAFRHGPLEMQRQDILTLVFSGEQRTRLLNQRLVRDLRARGRRCNEIGADVSAPEPLRLPSCDPLLQPILEILPIQLTTLALAALSGREAGRFEHASKITDCE